MVVLFWIIVNMILSMANYGLVKCVQKGVRQSFSHIVCINLINSILACLVFYIMGKFLIVADRYILGYGIVFSLFVTTCIIMQIIMYSKVSVAFTSLLTTCGTIITSIVYGVIVLGEPFSWQLAVAAVLLLIAAILPCRKMISAKSGISTVVLCIIWFAIWGVRAIFQKLYSTDPMLTDHNSMFFFTNVFSIVWSLLLIAFCFFKQGKQEITDMLKVVFKPKVILPLAANNIPGNLITIVAVILNQLLPLSVYSIVSSSTILIGSALLSVCVFKEKLDRDNYIALILAIIAIILKH